MRILFLGDIVGRDARKTVLSKIEFSTESGKSARLILTSNTSTPQIF